MSYEEPPAVKSYYLLHKVVGLIRCGYLTQHTCSYSSVLASGVTRKHLLSEICRVDYEKFSDV